MMIKSFFSYAKMYGFKKAIQKSLQTIIGVSSEEIETLQYFMNLAIDPTLLPPTNDRDLRIMQLCDAELLRLFDSVCKKHGITYWLDFGTLLGAVRHKGFIPWDDDMDVGMPRSEYDSFVSKTKDDFCRLGIAVNEGSGVIGVGYQHGSTGIWLDVFPYNVYHTDKSFKEVEVGLKERMRVYRNKYSSTKTAEASVVLEQRRIEIIGDERGMNRIYYSDGEFLTAGLYCHEEKNIIPVQNIAFENYTFNAPNDIKTYLTTVYGQDYSKLPKKGILSHDEGRGPLKTWAKQKGINMDDVLLELQHKQVLL